MYNSGTADMMDNYKIRQFEDSVIDMFNKSDLQIEIKRLVAQNVLNLLTKKADETITKEIQEMKDKTSVFLNSIDKSEIETILLSGSVSRGDYFPQKKENGEYNGMVDLIVMRKNGSSITADKKAIFIPFPSI